MMNLYNDTCFKCSKLITQQYSTSFSLGIKAFGKKFRNPIYAIYGFVRYADEIVDTFHEHDKSELIEDFKLDTFEAIESGISLNPVLQAFQLVVNQYQISLQHIETFFTSMEMDLYHTCYSRREYSNYIYGSAEVVGLMCLKVFCGDNEVLYLRLESYAKRLGAAFQKVNFLRDILADYEERGRVYFPGIGFDAFSATEKEIIEADIEQDFKKAVSGIKLLPAGARRGVYIAYVYYLDLFRKIRRMPPQTIVTKRVRISDRRKAWLMVQALVKNQLNVI